MFSNIKRLKIICHMVSSIDGRLLVDRWTPPAAGIEYETHYDTVAARLDADGWIVGRKSMEPFTDGTPAAPSSAKFARETFVAKRGDRDLAVAIDPRGRLNYAEDNAGGDHLVAVLGEQVSDAYLAQLRETGVSYVFAGAGGDDLGIAMDAIGDAFGVRTLLLEGGGVTNGFFLKAGLIDEISLLMYPGIDGLAGVPSIFEYLGKDGEKPAEGLALRHLATETLEGGVVWLRYAVERAA